MLRALAGSAAIALLALGGALWLIWPVVPERPPLTGELGFGTVTVDGLERRYEFYAPPSLPPGSPLVFILHGSNIDPSSMRGLTGWQFEKLADRERALLVFPIGFELEWNGCRSPGVSEADRRNLDDVGFVLGLIDRFQDSHAIDARRVYAVGFSNGGQMAYRLATDAPERLAGVAAIVAQVPAPENSDCLEPRGPIPVLIMNGTDDPIVPFEGGIASFFFGISARGRVLSTRESIEHWLEVNDLLGVEPKVGFAPDLDARDGSTVERRVWGSEDRSREVVLVTIHGGGHAFPRGARIGSPWLTARVVGRVNGDIDGAAEIWKFLSRHPAPMPASPAIGLLQ